MLIHREGAGKVCLFSSYFKSNQIPYYVKFYLKELRRFFDQVVMLTNNDREIESVDIGWLEEQGIDLMLVPNEGFDFGMWQKALPFLELGRLERLALVNDSCILFAPLDGYFDWYERVAPDVAGMVESHQIQWHIQSFFMVFSGRAISKAATYIVNNPADSLSYDEVVAIFELGLSAMLSTCRDLKIAVRHRLDGGRREANPSFLYVQLLLEVGLPLIKRKVMARVDLYSAKLNALAGRNPFPEFYIDVVKKMYRLEGELVARLFFESMVVDQRYARRFWRRVWRYRVLRWLGLKKKLVDNVTVLSE